MNTPYEPRWYRDLTSNSEMQTFQISYQETDLWIAVDQNSYRPDMESFLHLSLTRLRDSLDAYISTDTPYRSALSPYRPQNHCPPIAKVMSEAAAKAGVGPMSAVAGAFARHLAVELSRRFSYTDLIIENGGDIHLVSQQPRQIAIYAGSSPLSNKLALAISPDMTPVGICTSSGTVGHSLSFGRADAVTVLAKDTAAADAYATAIGNMVSHPEQIKAALDYSAAQPDILGTIVIIGEHIGLRGNIRLTKAMI